jgi:aspartate aminotransferase
MAVKAELRLARRMTEVSPSATLAMEAKAKKLKAEGKDIISFGAGEPDFDTPTPIKDAAIAALKSGFTKYTPAQGTLELRGAISEKLRRENALEYSPEEIVVSCGAKHSLFNLFQVLVEDGDEVLIPAPYWLSYPEMVRLAGGKPVFVPTTQESEFKTKPSQLAKYVTARTKALVLNSPSNPTSSVYSPEEIRALASFVKEHALIAVSDEIYEKFLFDGRRHQSLAAVDGETKHLTVTVNGHSKAFAMTGWRIGYLAARKEIAQAVANLQSHSTSNPTSFAQAGAVVALGSDPGDIEKMRLLFEKRRNLMFNEVAAIPKLEPFKPQGAFYLFCGIEKTGMTSMAFCEKLLDAKLVSCVPGLPFGSDQHIRLSFATSEDNIVKGVRRIKEFVESL